MNLRDIVAELNIQTEDGALGDIMADLDLEDQNLLRDMVYSFVETGSRPKYKYTARSVSRALSEMGYSISERTIQRYRQDARESK
jgi:hypothetical protein